MLKNPITGEVLPKDWKILRVDEIKSNEKYACVGGPFGSDISSKYFVEKGTPVIRGNNLTLSNDKFKTKGFVFVSKKQAQNYKGQHVKFNDLVFTCWGTIGQVGIIPENGAFDEYIISNKQLKLRVNEVKVNPTFIYYYFSTKSMVKYINNIAIGSAVPGINLGLLKNLPVVLPPKNEQDCIAKSLDYFFDLIENNNQRIKLLENMAEEIYKEWFVRFRFPGYKEANFLDKEGIQVTHGTKGAIPEGWERKPIKEIVDNKKEKYKEEEHSHLGIFDLSRMPRKSLVIPKFGDSDELESSRIIFRENDILFGSIRSYFHKVSSANKKGITNVSVLIFRPKKEIYRSYSLFTFFSSNFINWSINFSNGLKMPTISWNEVQNYSINKPTDDLLKSFEEIVFPMIKEIHILSDKNLVLQETRDLLLPRLISGKLSVEDLEM
jgi:type I restriction enzyme S subunit